MFGFWTYESSLELELRVEEFRRRNEPLTPPSTPETMSPLSSPPSTPRLVRSNPPNYYTPNYYTPTQLEFESDDE